MTQSLSARAVKAAASGLLAAALATGVGGGALAQPGDPNFQAQTREYEAMQQQYQAQQQGYQEQQDHYQAERDAYAGKLAAYHDRKDAYDTRRADYEAARAAYDARWGPGAFDDYQRSHTTTTTVYSPAGQVERRSSTTVVTPAP